MKTVLLADFGSTYTKVAAVDVDVGALLGTAAAFTTVETGIEEGFAAAVAGLEKQTGKLADYRMMACSSAAGGLRMVTSGLVRELTAEAARLASLGAGAKIVGVYSFELTDADVAEIDSLQPDIFLLTGGTDGGNKDYIIRNAGMLARCKSRFPVVIAGNRAAASECEARLRDFETYVCENVMPQLGTINVEPVQAVIRDLFLKRIVQAKGLSHIQGLVDDILMPTPSAVLRALRLLSEGTAAQPGLGDLMAVDLGGATTDVYSIAAGKPRNDGVLLRGLPEPYAKRTVEGDIGMRYSADGVLKAVGAAAVSERCGIDETEVERMVAAYRENPDALPKTDAEKALDDALAYYAIETATIRHAGRLDEVYTPVGATYVQTGKDLTGVPALVATGGAIIHNDSAGAILSGALFGMRHPQSLRPEKPAKLIDRKYILSAMGLLAEEYPETAFSIMKKELLIDGTSE